MLEVLAGPEARLYLRAYFCVSASSLVVYDYCLTIDDELHRIWRQPINVAKCLFLVCRYVGLIPLIILTIAHLSLRPDVVYSRHHCMAWNWFQTVVFHILLLAVEGLQLIKIHALYARHIKTMSAVYLFRTGTFVAVMYTSATTIRLASYDSSCLVNDIPKQANYFAAVAMSTQVFLSIMIVGHQTVWENFQKSSWLGTMSRDSVIACSIIVALLAMIITKAEELAHVLPSIFIAILSISGCRMVINVPSSSEKEDYGDGRTIATGSVKLSTYFESSLDIEPELDLHG
ncbi:hypothetical protein PC9H_000207 [Pleurotus ostreatus]|uniref:DUF6533 domain-containing protein n=1 Tax=Pleurotus ostreatus TaxID=5322 RepID=A0A8H7A0M9_PLEOS|nr:uncharacterized protein PC9H_000207 [Pleurotus ostreatus]KAF7439870.1 hypothetical protein PC9H_000207 [Pleurotus ostreatus]